MSTHFGTKPIIVGVDGSGRSIDALQRAAELAESFQVPLIAMAAWEYPVIADGSFALTDWSPERDSSAALDDAVAKAFPAGAPASLTKEVRRGSAARVLIEASQEASMLVVGSRGHGGFAGMLLGSVSTQCAQHAHCPVLVIHPPQTGS
jgi:nucleotide-binding universal stress UspA family protein